MICVKRKKMRIHTHRHAQQIYVGQGAGRRGRTAAFGGCCLEQDRLLAGQEGCWQRLQARTHRAELRGKLASPGFLFGNKHPA